MVRFSFLKVRPVAGFAFLWIVCAGCTKSVPQPEPESMKPGGQVELTSGPGVRILFLGNSLTAGNDIPGLVRAMAAPGGVNLEDHWNDGVSRDLLVKEKWDFLVLQQGPSSLPESQVDLKKWGTVWCDAARRHGVEPVFYMVWPFDGQKDGFELVSQSFRKAAKAGKAKVAAAGEAWRELRRLDPDVKLYSDNLHGTPLGSYLAALVLTHRLTGVTPEKVPGKSTLESGTVVEVPTDKLEAVRDAALKVIDGM
jgi:hypothetical protein